MNNLGNDDDDLFEDANDKLDIEMEMELDQDAKPDEIDSADPGQEVKNKDEDEEMMDVIVKEEENGNDNYNDGEIGDLSSGEQQNGASYNQHSKDGDTSSLPFKLRNSIKPISRTIDCSTYDIVPYVACLHSCPVYCVDLSWGLKWMFTGGADGFIRRYNFFDSVNGKLPLTVAQRHPFVDTITKCGVLTSYWENEQPVYEKNATVGKDGLYEPKLSPVYSLAVQSEALWVLSGLESGGVNLQTVRHGEGQVHHYFDKHKSAVSVLKLDDEEDRFLSGSWDKTILEWDLNTGKEVREFAGSSGQITALEYQPVGGAIVAPNIANEKPSEKDDDEKSLDSLFGDDDEDDVVKKEEGEDEGAGDTKEDTAAKVEHSQSVFLSGCIDGTIDIWDRRQSRRAGHLYVPEATPPWCTSACWSTDGNRVYVGRRNHSVEEFDIRKSLIKPSRTLKFPSVSGAVSTVAVLPSGRHLLCGSHDNLRLYDLNETSKSKTPFYIIPGHHGAVLSTIYVDPSCQYAVTASGSRGWQGNSTDVALVYEINGQP